MCLAGRGPAPSPRDFSDGRKYARYTPSSPGQARGVPSCWRSGKEVCLHSGFSPSFWGPHTPPDRVLGPVLGLRRKLSETTQKASINLTPGIRKKSSGHVRPSFRSPGRGSSGLRGTPRKSRAEQEGSPTLTRSLELPGFSAAESGARCFISTVTIKVTGRANAFTPCTL